MIMKITILILSLLGGIVVWAVAVAFAYLTLGGDHSWDKIALPLFIVGLIIMVAGIYFYLRSSKS